jgi:hypothetical protein
VNSLVILDDAKIEWQNSVLWYEDQRLGLGTRSAEVIEKKIELISNSPEQFPIRKHHMREAVVSVFPFSIVFEFHQKRGIVTIISIFHNRQNPNKKFIRRKK